MQTPVHAHFDIFDEIQIDDLLARHMSRCRNRGIVYTVDRLRAVSLKLCKCLGVTLDELTKPATVVAALAWPAMPSTTAAIWRRIGLDGSPAEQRLPDAARWGGYPGGLTVERGAPLFPRKQG